MFTTYILYSERINNYYVGSTGNILDRIRRHNTGRSNYTKRGIPWVIVFTKEFESKSDAYKYELYIKSQKSRNFIEELIANSRK